MQKADEAPSASAPIESNDVSAAKSERPIIVGLYGISGSGKSYLLKKLKTDHALKEQKFVFHDGSELLSLATPGGLEAFKRLKASEQTRRREAVLGTVSQKCVAQGESAVIAGHYMIRDKEEKEVIVGSDADWATYTHIVYLNTDSELAARRIRQDTGRARLVKKADELREWQTKERQALRDICREKKILFAVLNETAQSIEHTSALKLKSMLLDFKSHDEASNLAAVLEDVESFLPNPERDEIEKVILLDADKTLASQDTGKLIWKALASHSDFSSDPLAALFKSQAYTYASFRQAMLLYEELGSDLDILCEEVAGKIEVYPEMMALLARVAREPHVQAIVVTCGLKKIWDKILRRNKMTHVKVIGGGKMENGYVVTAGVKGAIAAELKSQDLRVVAFGDSPLDIEMLKNADEAYIVVGEAAHRSHSMDKALSAAMDSGLSACQILLPDNASPRLDTTRLAISHLSADATMARIFHRAFYHATHKPISKLLQTPTRNATISGPHLRKAHARIGFHLATYYLSQILGLSPHPIPHVQGHTTQGHTLTNESTTLIVPLMRGGEPMALGISKALPLASFAHATSYTCLAPALLAHTRALILVDSVINTGASLLEFLVPLRHEFPRVRVVVVAGVVQADALRQGAFRHVLVRDPGVCLVALRRSENAFVGKGGTDTGDRLFNTTFLD